ncbi:hypothetical protein Hdeb2414_s0006g00207731 [Helianthus debilis subsp. tardiflorus]
MHFLLKNLQAAHGALGWVEEAIYAYLMLVYMLRNQLKGSYNYS